MFRRKIGFVRSMKCSQLYFVALYPPLLPFPFQRTMPPGHHPSLTLPPFFPSPPFLFSLHQAERSVSDAMQDAFSTEAFLDALSYSHSLMPSALSAPPGAPLRPNHSPSQQRSSQGSLGPASVHRRSSADGGGGDGEEGQGVTHLSEEKFNYCYALLLQVRRVQPCAAH